MDDLLNRADVRSQEPHLQLVHWVKTHLQVHYLLIAEGAIIPIFNEPLSGRCYGVDDVFLYWIGEKIS